LAPGALSDSGKLAVLDELSDEFARSKALGQRMSGLFIEWQAKSRDTLRFDWIDYLSLPSLRNIWEDAQRTPKSANALRDGLLRGFQFAEEAAQVFFYLAVEDALPEELHRFQTPYWVNVWAVSLNPDQWEDDGLFAPTSEPRDLSSLIEEISCLFTRCQKDVSAFRPVGSRRY
jgi:hypothetical protein